MSYPSREHFCQLVDAIQKARKKDSDFSEVLSEYLGSYAVVNSNDDFVDSVIEFVESTFFCCGKLEYFVKNLDFGETRLRGKDYYANAGELYDYLIKASSKNDSHSP